MFNITRLGICIPHDTFDTDTLRKIKNSLTVTHIGYNKKMIQKQAFQTDRKTDKIYIAKMRGAKIIRSILPTASFTNLISEGNDIEISECKITLNSAQLEIKKYILNEHLNEKNIQSGFGSTIVELPAGQGKTYLAMSMINEFRKKTLVVVPDETLLEQWRDCIIANFPNNAVGLMYGKCHTDGDIVIASINTIAAVGEIEYKIGKEKKMEKSADWFRKFGFTVFDEIHLYCSSMRSEIFKRAISIRCLGLSATCNDRLDKMDPIAHYYVGDPKRVMELPAVKILSMPKFRMNAKILKYNGPSEYTNILLSSAGTVSHPLMINQISKDPYRNKLILLEILRLYGMGHCVFVFFDRVELVKEFVETIRDRLQQGEVIAPELDDGDIAVGITGGAKKETRMEARDNSRICCLTYQCGSVGLSFPRYTAAIYAHPRRSGFKQIINRIFRLGSDSSIVREAVYIVDNATTLKSQVSGFKKIATEEKAANIVTTVVDWRELVQL